MGKPDTTSTWQHWHEVEVCVAVEPPSYLPVLPHFTHSPGRSGVLPLFGPEEDTEAQRGEPTCLSWWVQDPHSDLIAASWVRGQSGGEVSDAAFGGGHHFQKRREVAQ